MNDFTDDYESDDFSDDFNDDDFIDDDGGLFEDSEDDPDDDFADEDGAAPGQDDDNDGGDDFDLSLEDATPIGGINVKKAVIFGIAMEWEDEEKAEELKRKKTAEHKKGKTD